MLPEHMTLWVALKNLSYIGIFIASVEWLGFNPQSLTIFGVLMLIDIITGVTRTVITDGGSAFTSALLKRGIASKLLLLTALLSVALTAKGVGYTIDDLVQGAVNVLSLGELYSILGNVHSVRTGKPKQEFDAVAYILSKIKEALKHVLK